MVGNIQNETISARGNSSDEKDGLKNYSSTSLKELGVIMSEEEFDNDSIKLASGQKDSKTVDGYKEIYDKKNKSPAMLIKIN